MKYLLSVFLIFAITITKAQVVRTDSICKNNVEKQGNIMADLLMNKDYRAFSKYTYQPIIDMAGGEEILIDLIKKGMEQIETQGLSFLKCSIERPISIIHIKNELQCTVTQNIVLKTATGRIVSKSTLIGISSDDGENWTFIDAHGKDIKTLQASLSNLSNDLIIPEKQKPVVYKD